LLIVEALLGELSFRRLHWKPLRTGDEDDMRLAEVSAERVVLSDDIHKILIPISSVSEKILFIVNSLGINM
jgi:hypothetical protein